MGLMRLNDLQSRGGKEAVGSVYLNRRWEGSKAVVGEGTRRESADVFWSEESTPRGSSLTDLKYGELPTTLEVIPFSSIFSRETDPACFEPQKEHSRGGSVALFPPPLRPPALLLLFCFQRQRARFPRRTSHLGYAWPISSLIQSQKRRPLPLDQLRPSPTSWLWARTSFSSSPSLPLSPSPRYPRRSSPSRIKL